MAVSEMTRPQGGRPVAVFYHFRHPTLYTYVKANPQSPSPADFLVGLDAIGVEPPPAGAARAEVRRRRRACGLIARLNVQPHPPSATGGGTILENNVVDEELLKRGVFWKSLWRRFNYYPMQYS
jgi:hypothetical protein